MEVHNDKIRSFLVRQLPRPAMQLLADLLNPTKVIPSASNLLRDWRGLSACANLTSEQESNIYHYGDKTRRILELWDREHLLTVGMLFDALASMDRYDVIDDLREALIQHQNTHESYYNNMIGNQHQSHQSPQANVTIVEDESELITVDDRDGYKQYYDAYILFAPEDEKFVEEIIIFLEGIKLVICTEEKLRAGHPTKYAPIVRLITERCHRIIVVYSPESLANCDNGFLRDYAQIVGIETRQNKILPIMYKPCVPPPHLAMYHTLRYYTDKNPPMYDFWEKLAQSFNVHKNPPTLPRIVTHNTAGGHTRPYQSVDTTRSALNIAMSNSDSHFLPLPNPPMAPPRSVSMEAVSVSVPPSPSISASASREGSFAGDTVRSKKTGLRKSFSKLLKWKKAKKPQEEVMAAS